MSPDRIPTLRSREARRILYRMFGLPNGELDPITCRVSQRLTFVDDDADGRPVARWEPHPAEPGPPLRAVRPLWYVPGSAVSRRTLAPRSSKGEPMPANVVPYSVFERRRRGH